MTAELKVLEQPVTAATVARILVVEDERIVARSLERQLASLDYEVVGSVASGEHAIRLAGALRPDLVLMDISLEGPLDGVAAAEIIRKSFRLPVVYLTAYSNQEIVERAKVTEPFGYILKPYQERELRVVIETALYKHRMERRQQEREKWFAATLKSIGDAVVATDEEGLITYMNPAAERLTGWINQEGVGEPLKAVVRLIFEGSRQHIDSATNQAMPDGKPRANLRLIAKDRSEKAIDACVSLIKDDLGEDLGQVLVFRDVTWWKHMEEQERQAKQMEAIGRIAGGVAHSLNNLTTTVLGHSEIILRDMKSEDPDYRSIVAIKRSATRTASLVQKLLAFGRKQNLTMTSVHLNDVVCGLALLLRNLQAGVRLELDLDPTLGRTKADAQQLEEAILTLARNACEAMPNGGSVQIRTANVELDKDYSRNHPEVPVGPYVLLEVSDSGIGMSADALSHLFMPFFTESASVGAGLGLAAVFGFVKQCGGDIEVQSQPEIGTTFRLYLPREVAAGSHGSLTA